MTVVIPVRTAERLLFMALHIILVSIRPETPTIAPTPTRRGSSTAKPVIEAAIPEKELSREITTGISAPPTLRAIITP